MCFTILIIELFINSLSLLNCGINNNQQYIILLIHFISILFVVWWDYRLNFNTHIGSFVSCVIKIQIDLTTVYTCVPLECALQELTVIVEPLLSVKCLCRLI